MDTEAKEFDRREKAEIKLNYPVTVDGVTHDALTMRRPKTKDSIRAAKSRGTEAEKGILLLANLCDVAPDVIQELDEIDAKALGEQLEAFRGGQSAI